MYMRPIGATHLAAVFLAAASCSPSSEEGATHTVRGRFWLLPPARPR
jgi:hypothetical protein